MEPIIANFFSVTTSIKLYHWKTKKYSEHVACDELYNNLIKAMDRIVEVYLGTTNGARFNNFTDVKVANLNTSQDVKDYIVKFVDYFKVIQFTPDINNIRDEAVADCNRFLYLQTLQ